MKLIIDVERVGGAVGDWQRPTEQLILHCVLVIEAVLALEQDKAITMWGKLLTQGLIGLYISWVESF